MLADFHWLSFFIERFSLCLSLFLHLSLPEWLSLPQIPWDPCLEPGMVWWLESPALCAIESVTGPLPEFVGSLDQVLTNISLISGLCWFPPIFLGSYLHRRLNLRQQLQNLSCHGLGGQGDTGPAGISHSEPASGHLPCVEHLVTTNPQELPSFGSKKIIILL